VKNLHRIAVTFAFLFLTAAYAQVQLPTDPEQRAKTIAQIMEANSSQLTLFDRDGKPLSTIGSKDLQDQPYQPVFSPDGKRLAVVRQDLDKGTRDIWVIDNATGKATRISISEKGERVRQPVWSPDGSRIAYVGLRKGTYGIYQKPSDGTGAEEQLLKTNTAADLGGLVDRRKVFVIRVWPYALCASAGRRTETDRNLPEQIPDWGSAPVSGWQIPFLHFQ
jgi:Tol biopolymer transport system component